MAAKTNAEWIAFSRLAQEWQFDFSMKLISGKSQGRERAERRRNYLRRVVGKIRPIYIGCICGAVVFYVARENFDGRPWQVIVNVEKKRIK